MILNQVRKKAALLVSGWSASYYPGIRNCEWMPEPDFRSLPLLPGPRTLDSSLDCLKSFDNLATYSRPTEEEIQIFLTNYIKPFFPFKVLINSYNFSITVFHVLQQYIRVCTAWSVNTQQTNCQTFSYNNITL